MGIKFLRLSVLLFFIFSAAEGLAAPASISGNTIFSPATSLTEETEQEPEKKAGDEKIIGEATAVFRQVLNLYATKSLEKPRDLLLCAYEMLERAERREAACRDKWTEWLEPEKARMLLAWLQGELTDSVSGKIIRASDPVGVITISSFTAKTDKELEKVFDEFIARGVEDFILDLRNNYGGESSSAVRTLAFLMDEYDILLTVRERNSETVYHRQNIDQEPYWAQGISKYLGFRIVVLINENTASAAEIIASVMREWGFPVVGTTSTGKGKGQTVIFLQDGSALKLTTWEWLAGERRLSVHGRGVAPDYEVKDSRIDGRDVQLEEAIRILRTDY